MLNALEVKYTEVLYESNVRDDPRDRDIDILMNDTFRFLKEKGIDLSNIKSISDLSVVAATLNCIKMGSLYDNPLAWDPVHNLHLWGLFVAVLRHNNNDVDMVRHQYLNARSMCDYPFLMVRSFNRVKPVWDAIDKANQETGINTNF